METAKAHRIPIYQIALVRNGSLKAATRRIGSPLEAAKVVTDYLADADREHIVVLLLDTKLQLIGVHTAGTGDLSSCIVHPREVYKPAIAMNASSIIIAHNHPSGDPTPSGEDHSITKRIVEAGKILGVPCLDHIIVGIASPSRWYSVTAKDSGKVGEDVWEDAWAAAG